MATIKLTDAKIKTLKPQDKIYRILDGDRLYIEIRPTGVKVWRFKFVLNGKESSMSFGEYPAVTLADARSLRDEAKAKLAKGIHPVEDRRQAAKQNDDANSFENIALEYKREKLSKKSKTYILQFDGMLEKDIPKAMKKKNVKDVTAADVLAVMKSTVDRVSKQNNYGTGETTAILHRTFIGAIIRYAIATLRAENDPTYAVRGVIQREEVQHARALTKEERHQVRSKLDQYSGTQTVKNAGFILLYTMLRSIEIRRMEWSWVDFDDRVVTFPKEAMKKNRIHVLPMSQQVYDIFQDQFSNTGNQTLVFPSVYKPNQQLSSSTLNRMLDYIGLTDVTAHDFRATASTLLYEKGYEEAWIERQLAHAEQNKTKASYDHSKHLEARRKMMQDWADIVDGWSKTS